MVNGPWITSPEACINFFYQPEQGKKVGIYFNSKNGQLNFYPRLLDGQVIDDSSVNFSLTNEQHDCVSVRHLGYVKNIYYTTEEVKAIGETPELLLLLRPSPGMSGENSELVLDTKNSFVMQTAMEYIEVLWIQIISQQILEGEWNYYSFYNNDNNDRLKVCAVSKMAMHL